MTTLQRDVQHRQVHEADPDAVSVRQPETDDEEGLFRIRMPVTSTAEARDGEAFGRDRIEGFREQMQADRIPLFLDHGRGGPGETRYGQLRKVGYWAAPDVTERAGATDLDADAVLVDPETLDESVGDIRAALSWLRAQAEAGLPISASVGWTEDVGERDVPGDADLLEISIVGIPSDPRTTTTTETVRARETLTTDGCPACAFRRALAERGIRPFGPPDGDGDEFDDVDDCVKTLLADDASLNREDAEAICAAWEQDQASDGTGADDATELETAATMTDDTTTADDESADTTEDAREGDESGIPAGEFRSEMLEMQRQQTETLSTLADAIRASDDEDDDDEDDDDDDEDMNESAADADETDRAAGDSDDAATRTVTLDGEERAIDDALSVLRERAAEAEPAAPKTQAHADGDAASDETRTDDTSDFGFAGVTR